MMHAEQVLIAELSRRTELLTKLQTCVQSREALEVKLASKSRSRYVNDVIALLHSFLPHSLQCWCQLSLSHTLSHIEVVSYCVTHCPCRGNSTAEFGEDHDDASDEELDANEAEDLDRDIETLEVRLSLAENGIEEAMAVLGLRSSGSGAEPDGSKPVKRTSIPHCPVSSCRLF